MKVQDLKEKKVLVLGMGREGKSTLAYLKRKYPGKKVEIADKNDGENYLDKLKNYDVIVKSPGIPPLPEIQKAKEEGKIVTSATNIFFSEFRGKIIGITGTKGKSTTAALIYEVIKNGGLDVYLVGNIGLPSLELLDKINENSTVVYELSSFQLYDLTKSPQIAVVTNIYPEHLDWHGSFENYKKAKKNIFKYQKKEDVLIQDKSGAEAAVAVGKLFNIPQPRIDHAIKNFKGLPHRLEFVSQKNGIKFYNDSLATNPYATIFGIKKLGKDVQTLIAGGFDRGLDYSVLSTEINKSNIKNLILFPDTGKKIGQGISKKIKEFNARTMQKAVKIAYEHTDSEKIVLLSPASASFNMFKDYEDRGNQFKTAVKNLGSN